MVKLDVLGQELFEVLAGSDLMVLKVGVDDLKRSINLHMEVLWQLVLLEERLKRLSSESVDNEHQKLKSLRCQNVFLEISLFVDAVEHVQHEP